MCGTMWFFCAVYLANCRDSASNSATLHDCPFLAIMYLVKNSKISLRASISEMIQGIDDSAKEYGYMIRLFVNDKPENEKDVWGNVIASSVDGILLMNNEMSPEVFELIQYTPVPVIFVNGLSKRKAFGSVCIDNEKCGYEITKMMIDKGNQKITFISTIHPYLVNELMVKGYIKAMKEAGLEPDIIKTTGVLEANEQHFTEYLDKNPVPEVALAVRDSMAISFMNVAQKRGIKVPDQLQVMGFQNTRYSQLSYPKLSCVENPIYEIGNVAMSELTDLMKDDTDKKPSNIIVDYKIVLRDSTK